MSKKTLFNNSRNELELKLLLLNTLEDFDTELANALQHAISKISDREIIELIIDLNEETDLKSRIAHIFKKLVTKNPKLKLNVERVVGGEFLEKYALK